MWTHRLLLLAALGSLAHGCAPAAEAVRPIARLAEPRATHTATLLPDGVILIAGGFRKGPDGRSQIYAGSTELVGAGGEVTAGPRLVHARAGHVAVPLADGRVLLAGGWDEGGMVRAAEVYEPARRRFTAVGALIVARGGFTATRLADGRVLICGGGDARGTRTAELFDPATDRFRPAGEMHGPRLGHTATRLADGRVLVAGGSAGRGVLATAELYDPATGAFTATGGLGIARYKHDAIRLADGRVLLVGGSTEEDWRGRHDSTEIFDPATGAFEPGPRLTTPRFKLRHALAIRPDGEIVVAGGGPTIEVIRPGRASRVHARLGRASYFGTATIVGDRVIVVGGYDDAIRTHDAVWSIAL